MIQRSSNSPSPAPLATLPARIGAAMRVAFGRAVVATADATREVIRKAAAYAGQLPWWQSWTKQSFRAYGFRRMIDEGYASNSAVYACVRVHANMLPEPEMHVWTIDADSGEKVKDVAHPFRDLIAYPNEHMTEPDFWEAFWTYAAIGGSAFIWIERDRTGKPIALWPLHRGQMAPIPDPAGFLGGYLYSFHENDTHNAIEVPSSDVLMFKWAVDPRNPLEGLSPLEAAARAVDTDSEILLYVYSLLRNDATPNSIIALHNPVAGDQLDELKARFDRQYGGGNRGSAMVIEGTEATVTRLGSNLQEMAAEVLHNIPETRIAAAFEVPAVLAGLNVGLQRAINANAKELREYYTESVAVPRWRRLGAMMGRFVRNEYGDESGAVVVEFDLGTVRALATDESDRRAMVRADLAAGMIRLDEARTEIGRDALDGEQGDVFYMPPGVTVVSASMLLPPPPAPVDPAALDAVVSDLTAAVGDTTATGAEGATPPVTTATGDSGGTTAKARPVARKATRKPLPADEALARRRREREDIERAFVRGLYAELQAMQEGVIGAVADAYTVDSDSGDSAGDDGGD